MGLTVTNNVASVMGQHNLNKTSGMLNKSLERLSSGLKINRGADGPAALVISEQQRAQIAGLNQAIENTGKAVSMVQTAEGGLNEINRLLLKVRSLALDSANSGVNDPDAQAANQAEIRNALETIDRIATQTQFGTKRILDGSAGKVGNTTDADVTFLKATDDTQAGSYAVAITTVGTRANLTGAAQTANLAQDETLTINGVSISLTAGMDRAAVKARINEFTSQTGVVADDGVAANTTRLYSVQFGSAASLSVSSNVVPAGGDDSGFSAATASGTNVVGTINGVSYTGVGNQLTATSGAQKGISVSFAADTGVNAINTVPVGAQGSVNIVDNSLQFQIGANANQTARVAVDNVKSSGLGLGVVGSQFTNLSQINVQTVSGANDTIKVVDQAIDDITTLRGKLGAFQQNTLEATANNLRTTLENTLSAESTIRDTDFAVETANLTKYQTLVQGGIAVLANANQVPQLVLSLLRG
jgi:flagellin